jgi:hypothetical protein
MFFIKDTYAKVWKIDSKEKYADVQISTSEKKKDTNEYINSSWNARFVGKAFNQLKNVSENDRVKITTGKVSNEIYKKDGKSKTFLRVTVFELADIKENTSPQNAVSQEELSDDLPF